MRAITIGLLMFLAAGPGRTQDGRSPMSPEESAKRFRTDDGLRLELVASEPQVHSRVAMAFGADGTLYVVEMGESRRSRTSTATGATSTPRSSPSGS